MTEKDLITIGIVTYNAQDTVRRAILSALAQDWPHKEIVVVDDCSQDKTADIVRQFAKDCDNMPIKLHVNTQNKGVAANRNKIIDMAHGTFIAFFDDDDESIPERLSVQHDRIVNYEQKMAGTGTVTHSKLVICHTPRIQYYPDGQSRIEAAPDMDMAQGGHDSAPTGMDMALRILTGRPVNNGFGSMPTCSQMARKALYEACMGFDENFRRCEDTELNVRIALKGGHFVGVDQPLVKQTMTKGSEKTLDEEEKYYRMLIEKHASVLDGQHIGFAAFHIRWLRMKFIYLRGQKVKWTLLLFLLFLRFPKLTILRILWALPNKKYNVVLHRFHNDKKVE